MLCATISDCGKCHDKEGKNGHLAARVTAWPFLLWIADAEEGIEDCQNEAKDIEENESVLHARKRVAPVHDEKVPL